MSYFGGFLSISQIHDILAVVQIGVINLIISENIPFSSALSLQKFVFRQSNETIPLTDSALLERIIVRQIDETLAQSQNLSLSTTRLRQIDQTVPLSTTLN